MNLNKLVWACWVFLFALVLGLSVSNFSNAAPVLTEQGVLNAVFDGLNNVLRQNDVNNSLTQADAGQYFRAVNPTPQTGIAQGVIASFSPTAGLVRIRNTANDTTRVYPHYIRLIPTVVPTSATRSELLVAIDDINRFSSGGSVLTARNVNMDSTDASVATINVGQLVLAAEGANVRRISRAQYRTVIPVAFEQLILVFGDYWFEGFNQFGASGGTTIIANMGPAILGPGDDLVVHTWHPGNVTTGASWEVEIAWRERKKNP